MKRIIAALEGLRSRLLIAELQLEEGDTSAAIAELEEAERDFRAAMQELRAA